MQLKKRFVQPNKPNINSTSEIQEVPIGYQEKQEESLVEAEGVIESPAQLPSRRRKHRKKRGITFVFSLCLLVVIFLISGGSTSWMKTPPSQSITSTSVTREITPEQERHEKPIDETEYAPPVNVIQSEPVDQQQAPIVPPLKSQAEQKPSEPAYKQIMKHKVEAGQTLYRISTKYYHSGKYADFLAKHNRLRSPSDLKSGTFIEVPYPPKLK